MAKLENIIATRKFTLSNSSDKVTASIAKPQRSDEGDYFCSYQITGIGSGKIKRAGGVDEFQSLILALKMIGADLYASQESQKGLLQWEAGENGVLGFPVPDSMKDILPPDKTS